MDDYLAKPFSALELTRVLERWSRTSPEPQSIAAGLQVFVPGRETMDQSELLDKLVVLFLTATRDSCTAAREAIQHADVAGLARAARSLRGAGATVGAEHITALADELEALGSPGRLDEADATVDRIEAELARLTGTRSFAS
jgi:HPt (histidine-containing phosphotransfer) domain-containing protein